MIHLIVHYHLRNGGVGAVIRREIDALQALGQNVCLLTGQKNVDVPCRAIYVAGLDYADTAAIAQDSVELLWRKVQASVGFITGKVVWHLHNPTLGCHRYWSAIAAMIAARGERMIYHIHDFAEDGRAENLAVLDGLHDLYPMGERIRYVVLSRRDAAALQSAGLPAEWCHVVPNPVAENPLPKRDGETVFALFPTRGIDRKNLGELCLLAALAGDGVRFATTLHPGLSRHQEQYGFWRQLARDLRLPIDFGVVEEQGGDLLDWLRRATHVVSTSRQEGFGMVFVESVAWGRPMIGRAIPHVDQDLREVYGVRHPYLYDEIVDENGRDFSTLSMADAAKWIAAVREGKGSVRVVRHGVMRQAGEWLTEAMANRQAFDPRCLAAFDAMEHGRCLMRIVAEITDGEMGEVRYLNRQRMEEFFQL